MLSTVKEELAKDEQLCLPMVMPLYCIRNPQCVQHRLENMEMDGTESDIQLTLFNQSSNENVYNFVPLNKYTALDIHVPSHLARYSRLTALAFALADHAVTRVGHLVQLTRADVQRLTNASEAQIDQLECALERLELKLNSRVPNWRNTAGVFHQNW